LVILSFFCPARKFHLLNIQLRLTRMHNGTSKLKFSPGAAKHFKP